MANRQYQQFRFSLEKYVVDLWANVTFGASGDPTLNTSNLSKGIRSISRVDTGTYLITLGQGGSNGAGVQQTDKYYKLLGINATWLSGATGPAAPTVSVVSNDVDEGTLTIVCQNGGTDTDPAEDEVLSLQITVGNSSAY